MTTPGGRKLGDAYIAVTANAEGVGKKMSAEVERQLDMVAKAWGEHLGESLGTAAEESAETIGETVEKESARSAERAGGAFGDALRKGLGRAIADLPDVELSTDFDADTSEARVQLMLLREQMAYLQNAEIGVDLDATEALSQLTILRARLAGLAAGTTDVDVRINARAAQAELSGLTRDLRQLSNTRIDLDLDTRKAESSANSMSRVVIASITSLTGVSSTALRLLGPIILGIGLALGALAPAAVAGLGALAGAAVVAATGLAVLGMALSGVGDAYKLLQRRSLDMALETGKGAKAASGVESAQRSLANTRQNAADQAVDAAERVMRAEEDLRETSVDTARAIEDAQRRAAESIARAVRNQEDADRSLTRALRDEADAMVALNRTRERALRMIEDLDHKVRENTLNQRQAVLDLADAEEELFWTQINRRSTGEQLERADIAYLRQQLRVEELRREAEALAKQQTETADAGVDGARDVTEAQRRLEDAQQAVADAQRDAADAARDVDEARVKGARDVAEAHEDGARRTRDALRAVDDALRDQERQARQSAFAIQQAIAAVSSAAGAAGSSGTMALQRINEELNRVNPAVLAFATFLYDNVRPAWEALQGTAAEGVLPGIQSGLESLINGPFWGQITSLVGTVSETLGGMFERAGERLNSPFWLQFFADLEEHAVPILEDMETIIWNLVEGFAGIVQAFLGTSEDMGGGLVDLTDRFAEWGRTLKDNPEFEEFLQDVQDALPKIAEGAEDFYNGFLAVWEFFEENGDDILTVMNGIGDAISAISFVIGILGTIGDFAERWNFLNGEGWSEVGESIVDGLIKGIETLGPKAGELWDEFVEDFKEFFGIRSPSSLFASFGGMILQGLTNGISGGFSGLLSTVRGLPGQIVSALGNLGGLLWGAGRDLLQGMLNGISSIAAGASSIGRSIAQSVVNFLNTGVIDALNNLLEFTIPGRFGLPSIKIDPPDIPRIPALAAGAIIERPTLAVVGEAGREVVLPLSPGQAGRRRQLMDEAGLGSSVSIDARQTYIVADTQTAEEVGAVVGQRVVRDIRTGVESRYGAGALIP